MEEKIKDAKAEYEQGKLKRRDFLRKLVLGGLSTSAAYGVLAGIGTQNAEAQWATTMAVGEEDHRRDDDMTTMAIGEEDDHMTTMAVGEEDRIISSRGYRAEDGRPTTFVVGEEDNVGPTRLKGEDGHWFTTYIVGEEDHFRVPRSNNTIEFNNGNLKLKFKFGG